MSDDDAVSMRVPTRFQWTDDGSVALLTACFMEEDVMKRLSLVVVMLAIFAWVGWAAAGTLDDVKAKGFVQVGVNGDLFGFGKPDEKGVWKGL